VKDTQKLCAMFSEHFSSFLFQTRRYSSSVVTLSDFHTALLFDHGLQKYDKVEGMPSASLLGAAASAHSIHFHLHKPLSSYESFALILSMFQKHS
jgi:hypothetical protein